LTKWIRSLCLVMLIAAIAAIPASAQDGTFGLSAADLQQLGSANDNSLSKDQFTFDYSVGLTVNGVGFPINVALSGTGSLDLINGVGNVTINGNASGTTIEGEMRVVGDLLYVRATDPTTGSDTGWFSFNVVEILDANPDLGSFGGDMSGAFLEGFAEGAGVSQDDFDPAAFQSMLVALAGVNPESFIGITRSDKGAQSVFTVDVSLSDLFRDPAMVPVAVEFLKASAISPATTTTEASAFNGVLADVFSQTIISADQLINTGTNLVDGASFLLDSTVDPAAIGEAGEVISVNFTLDVTLTSYDQPANIVAPPGAVEIPSSLILDALGVQAGAGTGTGGGTDSGTSSSGGTVALTCDSSAQDFLGDPGTSFSGTCPANCAGSLWGTDSYTDDSSICTAAIHAGAIPASGGDVTFIIGPEGEGFPGSTQNGITSSEWSAFWGRTFSFGAATSTGGATSGGTGSMVSLDCSTSAQEFEGGTGTSFTGVCPASCTGSLWGTDVYTDDSSICTAAVHAGAIPASGGEVTFTIMDGQEGYKGAAQNGITSSEWTAFWGRSFGFNGGGMSSEGSGNTTTSATTFSNISTFPSGLSFGFPDNYEILSETDIVTIVWIPSTANFIQVYDLGSLFGDIDMGLDFYKQTYGDAAAQAWNFDFNVNNFQEVDVNGAVYHVLAFTGTQDGQATSGQVILIPLAGGGYTYIQSYAVGAPPANFDADTMAIAASVTG
jgi:hypothetical protein